MVKKTERKLQIQVRVREYAIPPVRDMLVLGKDAAIGYIAMRRALNLLVKSPFEHIEVSDDVIGDVLIRQSLLKRVSQDELIDFVLRHIKPLLGSEEVLQVDMDVSVLLSGET